MTTPGRIAFEAYSSAMEGRTHDGRPIPLWPDLSDEVRESWEAAASVVMSLPMARSQQGDCVLVTMPVGSTAKAIESVRDDLRKCTDAYGIHFLVFGGGMEVCVARPPAVAVPHG